MINLFGQKLTREELRKLHTLSEQAVLDLNATNLRPATRRRALAKQLLRELLLDHGIDAPLVLIDIAVESMVRRHNLPFR